MFVETWTIMFRNSFASIHSSFKKTFYSFNWNWIHNFNYLFFYFIKWTEFLTSQTFSGITEKEKIGRCEFWRIGWLGGRFKQNSSVFWILIWELWILELYKCIHMLVGLSARIFSFDFFSIFVFCCHSIWLFPKLFYYFVFNFFNS